MLSRNQLSTALFISKVVFQTGVPVPVAAPDTRSAETVRDTVQQAQAVVEVISLSLTRMILTLMILTLMALTQMALTLMALTLICLTLMSLTLLAISMLKQQDLVI